MLTTYTLGLQSLTLTLTKYNIDKGEHRVCNLADEEDNGLPVILNLEERKPW